MSVPFSSNNLRVPRGFGPILEGLAREVLRDQPEDIPTYAARYFNVLLKKREESGMDPAEWAAKLEDRFYNNHAFKAGPIEEPATVVTRSEPKSSEPHTEDESSHAVEVSPPSTANPNVSEDFPLTENKGEVEQDIITEKDVISMEMELSQEESDELPVTDERADELSETEEEKDQTISTSDEVFSAANENDSRSTLEKDIRQSALEPTDLSSFSGSSNVNVCAAELGTTEDEGDQTVQKQETAAGDEEIRDSTGEKQGSDLEETKEFPYSGLADVNVCAEELERPEEKTQETMADAEPHDVYSTEQESSIPQMEETIVQSSLSEIKSPEANLEEIDEDQDQAGKTMETVEREGAETMPGSGITDDILATEDNALQQMPQSEDALGSDAALNEESLVEVSFDDVPEVQGITESGERQPVEEGSAQVSQAELSEIQQHEEPENFAEVDADQHVHNAQDHDETAIERVEKEVNPEKEETICQQEVSDIMKEKVGTSDSDSNINDDDEKGEGVKNISSSQQPTTETEEENPEDEAEFNSVDQETEEISEVRSHPNEDSEIQKTKSDTNDADVKDDEKTDMAEEDLEDIQTQGLSEMEDKLSQEADDDNAEFYLSQANESDVFKPGKEEQSETVEANAETLPGESEEMERKLVEPQPDDTAEGIEVTSKQTVSKAEEFLEEEKIDFKGQEMSDTECEEGRVGPTQSADRTDDDNQEGHGPLGSEKDTVEPEGKSDDEQEECSRPQEEEDIMDIPLDDPEANKAAAKIQAGFRGHMTRKKMKPEDKAEGEEVSSTGEALNGSQGDTETGGSGAVERDDTSVPEQ